MDKVNVSDLRRATPELRLKGVQVCWCSTGDRLEKITPNDLCHDIVSHLRKVEAVQCNEGQIQ